MKEHEWEQVRTYLEASGLTSDEIMTAIASYQRRTPEGHSSMIEAPKQFSLPLIHAFNGA